MTPDQARDVVEIAVHAPSIHNSQPWVFTFTGEGLDVRADRSRQLMAEDPLGRELLLSCGAAAWQAWLGARGLGRAATLRWSPEPGDTDLVARLALGGEQPLDEQERRLLDAVPLRHTDRTAFAPDPVPQDTVAALRAAAEHEGGWLADEQRRDQVLRLEALVARADRLLRQNPAARQELAAWVRGESHPADGVPQDALPAHGRGRGSSLALRDFLTLEEPDEAGGTAEAAEAADEPPVAEHPLLVVLGTPGDSPGDWVRAGAALARVLLTATAAGLVANPQTQVFEVPGLRARLRTELGLVGSPQLLLRVGWPTGPGSPHTGRRPVAEVLRIGRPDSPN